MDEGRLVKLSRIETCVISTLAIQISSIQGSLPMEIQYWDNESENVRNESSGESGNLQESLVVFDTEDATPHQGLFFGRCAYLLAGQNETWQLCLELPGLHCCW